MKKEIKIALIADIHLGAIDIEIYQNELNWFINWVKENEIDCVVILGDLFDRKIPMTSKDSSFSHIFLNNLKNLGITVIIEQGTLSHDLNQLDNFAYLEDSRFRIYRTTKIDNVLGMDILHIPEEYEDDKDSYYNKYLNIKVDHAWGHGQFDFAGFWASKSIIRKNKIIWSVSDFKNVKGLVDFGHVHIRMEKGICGYPGSFSRFQFGEEDPKGFYYRKYDIINHKVIEKKFIENKEASLYKTINFRDLPEKDIEFLAKMSQKCHKIRVIIDSDITQSRFEVLKGYTPVNPKIIVEKRIKGFSLKEHEESTKESDERKKERNIMLERYKDMDIFSLTKTLAKEKYNVDITNDDINKVFTNTFDKNI
jgi:DNA repair exonuclease SbcCD nuclease subunit